MNNFYGHLQFFAYITAGFLSLTVIALIIITVKHKRTGNVALFSAARNFTLTSFMIGLIYFISYYRIVFIQGYHWLAIFRGLDIALFILLVYFWIRLMSEITAPNKKITNKLMKWTRAGFLILLVVQSFDYIFLIDEDYYSPFGTIQNYVIIIQIIACVFVTVITIIFAAKCLNNATKKLDRFFIITNSITITANGLYNGITVIFLFSGSNSIVDIEAELFDPTALFFTLTNLLTLYFFYKHDFSPIYLGNSKDKKSRSSHLHINIMAEQYRLTERERDILIYVYSGYNNPEIAEKLHISKYTVRNHLHSIFEKLDVNNRIELLHLINEYKDSNYN